jgi:GNAT superfamily N-acetyltransferase
VSEPIFREARESDLPEMISLLFDDELGSTRESMSDGKDDYIRAFREIDASPCNFLYVAELDGAVVGVQQLTIIPGLTYRGGRRGLIEAVRIRADRRGRGLGSQFIRFAVEQARLHGCVMVQLTSNKVRKDAIRFYERLGFVASHEGMKLKLGNC